MSEEESFADILSKCKLQTIEEHNRETGHGNDYTYWHSRDEYVCNRCGQIMRKSK